MPLSAVREPRLLPTSARVLRPRGTQSHSRSGHLCIGLPFTFTLTIAVASSSRLIVLPSSPEQWQRRRQATVLPLRRRSIWAIGTSAAATTSPPSPSRGTATSVRLGVSTTTATSSSLFDVVGTASVFA